MNDLFDPDVEGIYETQLPLEIRAILKLGCVCAVDKKARNELTGSADIFHLDQLLYKSIGMQPYLRNVS